MSIGSTQTSGGPSAVQVGKRIVAASFWCLIALGGVVSTASGKGIGPLVVGLLAAAYAVYLWRGGTIVIVLLPMWIWLPLAGLGALFRRKSPAARPVPPSTVRQWAPAAARATAPERPPMPAVVGPAPDARLFPAGRAQPTASHDSAPATTLGDMDHERNPMTPAPLSSVCSSCGTGLHPQGKFCGSCGAPVSVAAATASSQDAWAPVSTTPPAGSPSRDHTRSPYDTRPIDGSPSPEDSPAIYDSSAAEAASRYEPRTMATSPTTMPTPSPFVPTAASQPAPTSPPSYDPSGTYDAVTAPPVEPSWPARHSAPASSPDTAAIAIPTATARTEHRQDLRGCVAAAPPDVQQRLQSQVEAPLTMLSTNLPDDEPVKYVTAGGSNFVGDHVDSVLAITDQRLLFVSPAPLVLTFPLAGITRTYLDAGRGPVRYFVVEQGSLEAKMGIDGSGADDFKRHLDMAVARARIARR
jgi:hypothetical protein